MATSQEITQIFTYMAENFDADKGKGIDAIVQFDLSGDGGGLYWLKIAEGKADAGEGAVDNPNMTLRTSDDDWLAMSKGELNPMQAFMSGKIKIQGDMGLAMKLQPIFSNMS